MIGTARSNKREEASVKNLYLDEVIVIIRGISGRKYRVKGKKTSTLVLLLERRTVALDY